MHPIEKIGASFIAMVGYFFSLIGLLYLSLKVLWPRRDMGQRDFVRQMLFQIYFTGVQAIGPVITLGLAVGVFAIAEGVGGIGSLSGAESLGRMVTVIVLREIGPMLTGGVVIARSVTAIASELGVMRVQREIDALEVMGISPILHLIAPRIFGGLLSLLALNVLFNVASLLGGYLIATQLVSIPASLFFSAVASAIEPIDLLAFSLKTLVGGLGIFLIACQHGMSVGRSPAQVPVAVSKASMNAFVYLVVLHAIISLVVLFYADSGYILGEAL